MNDLKKMRNEIAGKARRGELSPEAMSVWRFLQCSIDNVLKQPDAPILREFMMADMARFLETFKQGENR